MKTKALLAATTALLFTTMTYSQSQIWATRMNQSGYDDKLNAIAIDNSGNVYVTGYVTTQTSPEVHQDIVIIKYNSAGTQQWKQVFDGFNGTDTNEYDAGNAIAISYESGTPYVYVTGTCYNNDNSSWPEPRHDMVLIKYRASDGAFQWDRYEGMTGQLEQYGGDAGYSIAIHDATDDIYITGTRGQGSSTSITDGALWKFDKNGNEHASSPITWNHANNLNDGGTDVVIDAFT